MSTYSTPCSAGEVLDKISILEIKLQKINDPLKLDHIRTELNLLRGSWPKQDQFPGLYQQLFKCNLSSWENNELRRKKADAGELDAEFCAMSVLEIALNDLRFQIKSEINELANSSIVEQKSYT